MSNYKVTEKDLIGEIKDFPIEVVQRMLKHQVAQGNKEDIEVFQSRATSGEAFKGFTWNKTTEGERFWHRVIALKKFDEFFEKYPKNSYVYIYQDGKKKEDDVINTLIKYGGKNTFDLRGNSTFSFYYIRPETNTIAAADKDSTIALLIKHFYTEIQPESSVKEYTMQEIADKLGIDVNELRIKK